MKIDSVIRLSVIIDSKKNRLDKFLVSVMDDFSRSKIQSLIVGDCVSVNGISVVDPNYYVKFKDEISICNALHTEIPVLLPEKDVKFSVLYEDNDLIVVNKPAGVVVHPGAGNYTHTLVNGLAYHYGGNLSSGSVEGRPGIVHRIDKDTSGILVIAKNDYAHAKLAAQFSIHSIKRKYICFCYGVPKLLKGKIETFIVRDKNNRLKMTISKNAGKRAVSFYRVVQSYAEYASKIECELHTGRTHQIRVHMTHLGHSLIGDSLYKAKNYSMRSDIASYIYKFPRQALHAYMLEFIHPREHKIMHFEAEMPEDMVYLNKVLEQLYK